jgi:hypothetical protein
MEVVMKIGYVEPTNDIRIFFWHPSDTLLLIYVDEYSLQDPGLSIYAVIEPLFCPQDGGAASHFLGFQIKRVHANRDLWLS